MSDTTMEERWTFDDETIEKFVVWRDGEPHFVGDLPLEEQSEDGTTEDQVS